MTGRLLGIARKSRPKGAVETIDRALVGLESGIEGDFRGRIKPGGRGRRQVTAMMKADWDAAMAELGHPPVVWSDRRVNLLVDGIDLPRDPGARLRIGSALFEITGECDPCQRMEGVAVGLEAALTPDWRGGRTMRVIGAGAIALGDPVTLDIHNLREAV
ncbi:MOSC domain-containing protein [Sphingomonas abietis]|uniref:MOSC domain-containing protein n=1 Tax=Sphingomonas abietis TaxID=3012344 RepID=A0ABY7NT55_9SPHN|nr:MOSC domain-containing protein [Sphingomonas abietis]WBO23626.1 MOSC domain-containing protein [Sphingomonas abietis]